jgi:hypothetical protein
LDEISRKALESVRDEILTAEARLYEHNASTYRWLMATLFTANGAGLLALIGKSAEFAIPLYAFASFALGLILSISIGALSVFTSYRMSMKASLVRGKVIGALISDMADQAFVDDLLAKMNAMRPNWKTWFPSYAAVASLLCLIIGMITAAGPLELT